MRVLTGVELERSRKYIDECIGLAKRATCERSRCGSIVVSAGKIIGRGWNSPPADLESQRRCTCDKDSYHRKVTDKTCCMHAEQRAIMDALAHDHAALKGSTLYFIRLGDDDTMSFAGQPYCTVCSKMALDAGVHEFVLWHESGVTAYDTKEYNTLSYKFRG